MADIVKLVAEHRALYLLGQCSINLDILLALTHVPFEDHFIYITMEYNLFKHIIICFKNNYKSNTFPIIKNSNLLSYIYDTYAIFDCMYLSIQTYKCADVSTHV